MNTRQQAIEAAAEAAVGPLVDMQRGHFIGDTALMNAHGYAEGIVAAALAAAVPVLLNDLADAVQDAIENDRRSHNVVPGLGFAVELETAKLIARDAVRAAAEGWAE